MVFRADGKGTTTYQNNVATGSYQGVPLSEEIDGTEQFRWKATETTIDYRYTKVNRTFVTTVGGRGSSTSKDTSLKERNGYTTIKCTGTGLSEKYRDGTMTWVRTDEYGVY